MRLKIMVKDEEYFNKDLSMFQIDRSEMKFAPEGSYEYNFIWASLVKEESGKTVWFLNYMRYNEKLEALSICNETYSKEDVIFWLLLDTMENQWQTLKFEYLGEIE